MWLFKSTLITKDKRAASPAHQLGFKCSAATHRRPITRHREHFHGHFQKCSIRQKLEGRLLLGVTSSQDLEAHLLLSNDSLLEPPLGWRCTDVVPLAGTALRAEGTAASGSRRSSWHWATLRPSSTPWSTGPYRCPSTVTGIWTGLGAGAQRHRHTWRGRGHSSRRSHTGRVWTMQPELGIDG